MKRRQGLIPLVWEEEVRQCRKGESTLEYTRSRTHNEWF